MRRIAPDGAPSNRSTMRGLAACALAAACGNGAASDPDAGSPDAVWPTYCPGYPPQLAYCTEGTFYLECGGDGPPLFACGFDGIAGTGCAWFPGGCVARGWRASTCPADFLGYPAN